MATEKMKKGALIGGAMMGAVATVLGGGFASTAGAAPVTFAQFQEANSTANVFSYTAPATGSGGTLTATAIPITFSYQSLAGMPADLTGVQNGLLTLVSATDQPVALGFGNTVGQQLIDNLASGDKLTLTRLTPAAEGGGLRTNLLTMTFTGNLTGGIGGFTAALSGQTGLGFTVNYTSDFLNFSSTTVRDYSMNFTSWITTADGNGLETASGNTSYQTATAAGTGSFDAAGPVTVSVPEPTSIIAAAGLGILLLRRRREASPAV